MRSDTRYRRSTSPPRSYSARDEISGRVARYDYDEVDNLISAEYERGGEVERHQQAVAHAPRITYSFIQNTFAVPLHNAYFDACFGTHLFYSFKNIVFFLS